MGKLSVAGALHIGGDAQFDGDTIFSKLASFIGDTLFKGGVVFERAPTFGADTAGFAIIRKGEKKVRILFGTEYVKQPIVTVSMTNDVSPLLDDEVDKDLKADIALVEKDYLDTVFDADVKYIVTEKSTGFTIVLNKKAPADLQFSWVAIAVQRAGTAVSAGGSEEEIVSDPIAPLPAEIPADPVPQPQTATEASDDAAITAPDVVSDAALRMPRPSQIASG